MLANWLAVLVISGSDSITMFIYTKYAVNFSPIILISSNLTMFDIKKLQQTYIRIKKLLHYIKIYLFERRYFRWRKYQGVTDQKKFSSGLSKSLISYANYDRLIASAKRIDISHRKTVAPNNNDLRKIDIGMYVNIRRVCFPRLFTQRYLSYWFFLLYIL